MKKDAFIFIFFSLFTICGFGQIMNTKIVDDGGSGPYKSIAVTEKTLEDFVIYQPKDIRKVIKKEGKLPILVWANGGCMDSSIHNERFLTEIASHGYMIIAIGKLQMTLEERVHKKTSNTESLKAIEWISEQSKNKDSNYFNTVDLEKIGVAGMSCGGAQTLRIAGNSKIKTYLILNAGMGDMTMAGASKESLKLLHADIIYIVGGESDIAYQNALLDYERITHVPVAFACHKTAGHEGTYNEEFGGSFARMALDWLNWQFKDLDNSDVFIGHNLSKYPNWTIKSKNFNQPPK